MIANLKRLIVSLVLLVLSSVLLAAPVFADPPAESGTAPVGTTALSSVGHVGSGNDLNGSSICNFGNGRHIAFLSGDVNNWVDPSGAAHPVAGVFATDADSGFKFLWSASSVNNFVQTVDCVVTGPTTAKVYVGGNFTSFMGQPRQHTALLNVSVTATTMVVSLGSWAAPLPAGSGEVRAITTEPNGGRVFLAYAGGIMAVGTAGKLAWSAQTPGGCPALSVLWRNGSLYAGGLFPSMTVGNRTIQRDGLVKLDDTTGAPDTGFNAKLRPSTTCAQHNGYIPLSMTWDGLHNNLIVGEGGAHRNRLQSVDPTSGASQWTHLTDGDVQTVTVVGKYVFAGHHRGGPNLSGFRLDYGWFGGFFNLKTGVQAAWNLNPDFHGTGANADGRNNGIITSFKVNGMFCAGGSFNVPTGKFACYQITP